MPFVHHVTQAVPGPVLTPALVDDTSSRGVSRSGAQVSDHKHVKV